jgi:2-oxoglutarate dehydrogenase complex dehydrogenase (E1) component-like enzyme
MPWQQVRASLLLLAGISSADPRHLVLWEAPCGDFANAVQSIITQFNGADGRLAGTARAVMRECTFML